MTNLYKLLPKRIEEVDVIIAGGGTAGCIVAARLADADSNLSILVVESGRDNYESPTVIHPALWRGNHVPSDPKVYVHKSAKEKQLGGRESLIQVGNTLGGGSSINLMMYVRAQKCDFDSWNMEGWRSEEMGHYMRKVETYHGTGTENKHGVDGPIHVSKGPFRSTESEEDFINAMMQVGYPRVEDMQDLKSIGVESIRKYVSSDGRRQDTAHAYLHPRLRDGKHPGLHVLVETQVVRVMFDEDLRASAVELRPNPAFQPDRADDPARVVKARKLVVLSCGTLGTPSVLERSGVGQAEVLENAGVPLVTNLPGVGHDYQDHHLTMSCYKSNLPSGTTTDDIHGGYADIPKLLSNQDPILGWNGIDASSKIRPLDAEVERLGDKFKQCWDEDFEKVENKPLVSLIFVAGLLGDRGDIPQGQYFSMAPFTAYPYSRGHVHITGRSIDDRLDFVTGFLTDKSGFDLKTQIWPYKKQREVARRMRIYEGEVSHRHPSFPPGSTAAYNGDIETIEEPASTMKDIVYAPADDKIIEDWIRMNLTTCWHGIGTCKMAPLSSLGVVDENLGVHGVQALKIADLSVIPGNVGSNTMNTALIIGEKAADVIIRELGLWQ
ncbi:hypothetical protein JX265_012440 [Neoarthrinium moseri]|uniref:Glucose-methanol-choline oxidoreductase N-terminal domain-containing protein n=1 Tax=Neoarthrinium moseri TaxID=1658444 RepID=A0A9P9WAW9_9PEZI|nr:hypothetical protein JX265_012440 [Neoarthrinium moseri]